MAPRIVIAAGGTAGHVVPALAVADALRAEAGAEVVFVGGERAEAELVPGAGYELRQVSVTGIPRKDPVAAARAVMGGGGYVAGVCGAAAVRRRVPLVLTEADSHLGVSNRLLARRARALCLAFPIDGVDGVVTGRPVPPPVTDRAGARERLGLPADATVVLVFGGSLGARSINEAAVAGLDGDFWVLHAAGRRDFAALEPRAPQTGRYLLRDYLAPFGDALAAADLCVARSGGSIFEVAAHGLPAVLVPYPHATADHQTGNARWMVDAGAAVLVRDDELTPERLRAQVDALLGDPARLAQMAAASAALARPDAAQAIAQQVLAAARSESGQTTR
jgi:UDP-N-acetylglucosamine--N-acetylmuramyl-(pentapeptide) pyrophosphoryl-undecaprenol N-acetylglucosamine transferase